MPPLPPLPPLSSLFVLQPERKLPRSSTDTRFGFLYDGPSFPPEPLPLALFLSLSCVGPIWPCVRTPHCLGVYIACVCVRLSAILGKCNPIRLNLAGQTITDSASPSICVSRFLLAVLLLPQSKKLLMQAPYAPERPNPQEGRLQTPTWCSRIHSRTLE